MVSKIADVICGGKTPKCHEPSSTELYRLEEKFQNAVYPITQHLLSYLPHNIITSTEVEIVVKKKDFWINLDILTLVFIFIPSWGGKYEIDRLLNVLDLIQRCFAFILESLKRVGDRCVGNRTFIHISGLPFPRCWWSFRTRPCSRCCRAADAWVDERDKGSVGGCGTSPLSLRSREEASGWDRDLSRDAAERRSGGRRKADGSPA